MLVQFVNLLEVDIIFNFQGDREQVSSDSGEGDCDWERADKDMSDGSTREERKAK